MLIAQKRSLIPACDVAPDKLEALVKVTTDLKEIGAYKLGFMLGLSIGLPRAVEIIRKYSDKPIIYDHQKAGTDIPDTGAPFAKVCKTAGIDAVILFPQAGPETERAWIMAAREQELEVLVGGLMTHKGYTQGDGGWIADDAVLQIYLTAREAGVVDFIVPGTKPEATRKIREMLERQGITPTFYSPGLGAQGGSIRVAAQAAGPRFHPIVGRALYSANDMRTRAQELIQELA